MHLEHPIKNRADAIVLGSCINTSITSFLEEMAGSN